MRPVEPADLLRQHASRGMLLDSNLLLLFVVGAYDRELVGKFKRLQTFAPEDFDTLIGITGRFHRIFSTPNVLTEVSNLAGSLGDPAREACFRTIATMISSFEEVYVPSTAASMADSFTRFGLTDSAISILGRDPTLVLTDDFRLAQWLESRNIPVLNFNHIRHLYWQ